MAMFNKQGSNDVLKDVEAVIGPNVKVRGRFNCDGNVIVEGELNGSIKSGGFLLVGDQAKIIANIEANEARIGGVIHGNIKVAGVLYITSNAQISGDIECEKLAIEEGAVFVGRCSMGEVVVDSKVTKKQGLRPKKSKALPDKTVADNKAGE